MSSIREQIDEQLEFLSEQAQREVLDYIVFLRQRQEQELSDIMDVLIAENLEALEELAK